MKLEELKTLKKSIKIKVIEEENGDRYIIKEDKDGKELVRMKVYYQEKDGSGYRGRSGSGGGGN